MHRFIPARAGNGPRRRDRSGNRPVHPRACGERWTSFWHGLLPIGSSPRVRGTAHAGSGVGRYRRFIPARAGNGLAVPGNASRSSVHPRACGERVPLPLFPGIAGGSSPRVRGTGIVAGPVRAVVRFIPARAGNGSSTRRRPSGTSVHPRACGERSRKDARRSLWDGSSPRVRGTGGFGIHDRPGFRFIPARAGNGHFTFC